MAEEPNQNENAAANDAAPEAAKPQGQADQALTPKPEPLTLDSSALKPELTTLHSRT